MTDGAAEVLVIGDELSELARVRQWARKLFASLDSDTQVDALAVVDELTSNALRHSRAPFRISVYRRDQRLRVEVADGSPEPAAPRTPCDDGGRGLLLIEAYSLGWGQELHPDGKVVWAELELATGSELAGHSTNGSTAAK
ncbi:MAG TPA: ATP-binding protein [Actinophytocola sp.]|nr:ATP-binding protein [Actinophytocola sp.]